LRDRLPMGSDALQRRVRHLHPASSAGSLPASDAAAWMMSWVWVPACGLIVLLCLLFPDGRLPSRRWRWFAWLSLLLVSVSAISQALAPGSLFYLEGIYNPLGVEGLPNVGELVQTLVYTLIFVSVASLFVRRLRTSGVERQQQRADAIHHRRRRLQREHDRVEHDHRDDEPLHARVLDDRAQPGSGDHWGPSLCVGQAARMLAGAPPPTTADLRGRFNRRCTVRY
jgi:hypothetical protein